MRIEITIKGKVPMLLNRFTDAQALAATEGTSGAQNGERGTPLEQATNGLYLGHDEKTLIIPQPNLMRCIVEGGSFFKAGKAQVTTQKKSLLYACLDIEEAEIPIVHKEPWTVDTRAVRIPATGGRILRYRPCFNDWQLTFTCELDTEIIGPKLFRDIVDAAGKRVGLGDFRPATKGPFGKFVVTNWKEIK